MPTTAIRASRRVADGLLAAGSVASQVAGVGRGCRPSTSSPSATASGSTSSPSSSGSRAPPPRPRRAPPTRSGAPAKRPHPRTPHARWAPRSPSPAGSRRRWATASSGCPGRWCTRCRATMRALTSGVIGERHAVAVVQATSTLSLEDRAEVDRRVGPLLGRLGVGAAGRAARRVAAELDAASVVRRMEEAARSRRVTVRPAPDGMAYLTVLAPAARDGRRLRRAARPGRRRRGRSVPRRGARGARGRGGHGRHRDPADVRPAVGQVQPLEVHLVMTDTALLGPDAEGPGAGRPAVRRPADDVPHDATATVRRTRDGAGAHPRARQRSGAGGSALDPGGRRGLGLAAPPVHLTRRPRPGRDGLAPARLHRAAQTPARPARRRLRHPVVRRRHRARRPRPPGPRRRPDRPCERQRPVRPVQLRQGGARLARAGHPPRPAPELEVDTPLGRRYTSTPPPLLGWGWQPHTRGRDPDNATGPHAAERPDPTPTPTPSQRSMLAPMPSDLSLPRTSMRQKPVRRAADQASARLSAARRSSAAPVEPGGEPHRDPTGSVLERFLAGLLPGGLRPTRDERPPRHRRLLAREGDLRGRAACRAARRDQRSSQAAHGARPSARRGKAFGSVADDAPLVVLASPAADGDRDRRRGPEVDSAVVRCRQPSAPDEGDARMTPLGTPHLRSPDHLPIGAPRSGLGGSRHRGPCCRRQPRGRPTDRAGRDGTPPAPTAAVARCRHPHGLDVGAAETLWAAGPAPTGRRRRPCTSLGGGRPAGALQREGRQVGDLRQRPGRRQRRLCRVEPVPRRRLTSGRSLSAVIRRATRPSADPISGEVAPQQTLAVSIHVQGASGALTAHNRAMQSTYKSTTGDFAARRAAMPPSRPSPRSGSGSTGSSSSAPDWRSQSRHSVTRSPPASEPPWTPTVAGRTSSRTVGGAARSSARWAS